MPKIGDKVYMPSLKVFGEILEIADGVNGIITKVRIANADGTFTDIEVRQLVVDAVVVVRNIMASDIFKVIANWVKGWFKKK